MADYAPISKEPQADLDLALQQSMGALEEDEAADISEALLRIRETFVDVLFASTI